MPVMVFHAPFELQENPTAASVLRPVRMLKAFENIGYKVWKVTGTGKERKKSLRALGRAIRGGLNVEFVYSESATIPNSFTEPRHFPLRPFLDAEFFALMHRHSIPIGVFYRDIYWAFDEYKERVGGAVAAAMSMLYRWDLAMYNRYIQVLFLPSVPMAEYIPGRLIPIVRALPPGTSVIDAPSTPPTSNGALELFYVGGTAPEHYDLSVLLQVAKETTGVHVTICTPEDSWPANREEYGELISDAVTVVHRDASQLDDLYNKADIALLYVRPQTYRDFAMPVKLFEYLGRGKPVIASAGTLASNVVQESGAGWSVPYAPEDLSRLLRALQDNPAILNDRAQRAARAGAANTWEARARYVTEVMSEFKGQK